MAIPLFKKKEERFNEEIASMVNKEYVKRQRERSSYELQWRLNGEFVNGNQYVDINTATNSIEEIAKLNWWQEREVFNQISTIYETRVSRLTRNKPKQMVMPSSGEEKDISTAIVSSHLLQSTWYDQNFDGKFGRLVPWLELQGTVFIKPIWDTKKGRAIFKEQVQTPMENEEEIKTPDLQGQQERVIYEGDIDSIIVPAHEIFPDSSFRDDIEEVRSLIHAKAYHVDDVKDKWGVKVDSEKVDIMSLKENSSSGGLGYKATTFRYGTKGVENHVIVKEYYEMPSLSYPQGRLIIVAGDKTLHIGVLPYMIGENGNPALPFVRITSIDVAGRFWGKSVVERLIPIQRRYNALRNRKAEYLNMVSIGQWYLPMDTLSDDSELNNAPANIIEYDPRLGSRPEPVQYSNLPASFENEEQTLLQEFTAISGVSELSRYSQAPTGVKSGIALSIANEQDDTRLGKTASNVANGIMLLGKYWLRLFRQFVQEPRILRAVGTDRTVEVRLWSKSDLTSDDVIIENISALAESPSQKRQMVFDLINLGVFNHPERRPFDDEGVEKILKLLEFGHWETGNESMTTLQKQRANREGRFMMEGQQMQVMDYDDHMIHIEYHNRTRMSSEYEELLRTPQGQLVDQLMRIHLSQHYQIIAQEAENYELSMMGRVESGNQRFN